MKTSPYEFQRWKTSLRETRMSIKVFPRPFSLFRSTWKDYEKWIKFKRQKSSRGGSWKWLEVQWKQDQSLIEPVTTFVAFGLQNVSLIRTEVRTYLSTLLQVKKSWQSVAEKVWQIIFPLSTGYWEERRQALVVKVTKVFMKQELKLKFTKSVSNRPCRHISVNQPISSAQTVPHLGAVDW